MHYQLQKNRKVTLLFCIISTMLILTSCIKDDIINDFVEPDLRITNIINELQVDDNHTLNSMYLNNVGIEEQTTVTWSSSSENIALIDNNGTITAISEGTSIITAEVTIDNIISTAMITVAVVVDPVTNPPSEEKTGSIITTSSYALEGSFNITATNQGGIEIRIDENYHASSSLPGLYIYLSNNPNTTNGAFEIGPVTIFDGAHNYEIENIGINDYKYILYWCKPFNVKVGEAEIE